NDVNAVAINVDGVGVDAAAVVRGETFHLGADAGFLRERRVGDAAGAFQDGVDCNVSRIGARESEDAYVGRDGVGQNVSLPISIQQDLAANVNPITHFERSKDRWVSGRLRGITVETYRR